MKYLIVLLAALFISCASTKCPCENDLERIEIELKEHKDLPSYERIFLLQSTIDVIKMEKISKKKSK
jgi:hypothetical protein